ncbi:MAG: hypothetical protein O2895_05615 [Chloroflexi bacterium]|nr:hypothetical protein [Chloroflexota bacterium]
MSAVELLDRLQAQAVEIGELRALTLGADSARLQAEQATARADALAVELLELRAKVTQADALEVELFELRAEVAELQAPPRRRLLSRFVRADR